MTSQSDGEGAAELVWPTGIRQASRPPRLVYLDLNHWINLGKARLGQQAPDGYVEMLAECIAARERGAAAFVLSASLLLEITKIKDPAQRQHLADTIQKLTDHDYLLDRPTLMRFEIESALDGVAPIRPWRYIPLDLPVHGLLQALGRKGGLKIVDKDGDDLTEQTVLEQGPGFAEQLHQWEELTEHMLIAGPRDDEIPQLVELGYNPEVTWEVAERRVQQERDFAAQLNPTLRRGRLRDAVGEREVVIELGDALAEELEVRGTTFDAVITSREDARRLALCMPSTRTAIELKTWYHRNPNRKWVVNDINDLDALAIAVPYCDIVFADAAAISALIDGHIGALMGTEIPRRPADLKNLLQAI